MRFTPNTLYLTLILFLLPLALAACGPNEPPPSDRPAAAADFEAPLSNRVEVHQEEPGHDHLAEADLTAEVNVVLVPTELVVGPNRFAVGLLDQDGQLIHEAEVHFHYFDLSDPQRAILEMEADAGRLQSPDGLVTMFTHERGFAHAGDYGVEVETHLPDGRAARSRVGFRVEADTASPGPGEPVPRLRTPTLADVNQDFSLVTSARQPNPAFYEQSLDQALTSGKPTLLLFATPEFCQTRFCGPAYQTFDALHQRYGDRVNFIHIEVFAGLPNPANSGFKLSPTVEAFGLQSDPWLYLIDQQGSVLYRLEGLFTAAEIERQLQARLGL